MLLPNFAEALELSLEQEFNKQAVVSTVTQVLAENNREMKDKIPQLVSDLFTQLQIQKNMAYLLLKFATNYDGQGEENRFTEDELHYIAAGLQQLIADGFADEEGDDSPVVTALMKICARQGNIIIEYESPEEDEF